MPSSSEEAETIKAVLFDLDGTLIDSDRWHADALEIALKTKGYSAKVPSKFSTKAVFAAAGVPEAEHERIIRLRWDYAMELARSKCRPDDSVRFALAGLKIDGFRTLIVSNSISDYVITVLGRAKLAKYVDGVLAGDMGKHKPSGDLYTKAWTSIRVAPTECLAIEDSDSGIAAATEAGVPAWKVIGPSEISYDNVIRRIREIESKQRSDLPDVQTGTVRGGLLLGGSRT